MKKVIAVSLSALLTSCSTAVNQFNVKENRRKTSSREITLSYRTLGSSNSNPTIFHFTGGPGISNLKHKYPDDLLKNFNIVEEQHFEMNFDNFNQSAD